MPGRFFWNPLAHRFKDFLARCFSALGSGFSKATAARCRQTSHNSGFHTTDESGFTSLQGACCLQTAWPSPTKEDLQPSNPHNTWKERKPELVWSGNKRVQLA